MTREEAIRILMGYSYTPQERAALETLIPELRESEDERIRKEIKDIVLSYRNNCVYEGNHHFDECLDWLEKQKEQKPNPTEDMPYITVGSILKLAEEELLKGFVVQKPEQITDAEIKESMDAVTNFKVFAADLAKTFNITHQRDIDWHNFCAGLLTYLERNKPAEWSEEDENKIESIKGLITMGRFADANTIWTIWNLLDSLRPSRKPSEVCYGEKGDPDPAGVWKPSEEQMSALNALNCHGDLSYVGQQNQLISLQKDLEKLKGGVAPMRDIDE